MQIHIILFLFFLTYLICIKDEEDVATAQIEN